MASCSSVAPKAVSQVGAASANNSKPLRVLGFGVPATFKGLGFRVPVAFKGLGLRVPVAFKDLRFRVPETLKGLGLGV